MSLRVAEVKGLVSVQDEGRFGHRHLGISWQGPMDRLAYEAANWLCGNPQPGATLELGMAKLTVIFAKSGHLCYCGPAHDGLLSSDRGEYPIYSGYRYHFQAGDQLRLTPNSQGVYGYLAFSGGINLPGLLSSCSGDPNLNHSSLPIRPLAKGDELPIGNQPVILPTPAAIGRRHYRQQLRYLPSPKLDAKPLTLKVSSAVSRMGIRLESPQPAAWIQEAETKPVFPGAIQLPGDHHPIVLTRGCQTTGGYPVIGYLLQPDLDDLAQAPPGSQVSLSPCTMEEALRAEDRYHGHRHLIQRGLYGTGS